MQLNVSIKRLRQLVLFDKRSTIYNISFSFFFSEGEEGEEEEDEGEEEEDDA